MASEWQKVMPCGVVVNLVGSEAEDQLTHYMGLDARSELLAAKIQQHQETCEVCQRDKERQEPYRPCVGCGYCCKKAQCTPSVREFGLLNKQVCPALHELEGRYWCGLVMNEYKLPEDQRWASKYVGIGAGCCSPLNSDRRAKLKGGF